MDNQFGIEVARRFNRASEAEWPQQFRDLIATRRLTEAVGQMNALVHQPEHRQEVIAALKRMGLWHDDLGAHG